MQTCEWPTRIWTPAIQTLSQPLRYCITCLSTHLPPPLDCDYRQEPRHRHKQSLVKYVLLNNEWWEKAKVSSRGCNILKYPSWKGCTPPSVGRLPRIPCLCVCVRVCVTCNSSLVARSLVDQLYLLIQFHSASTYRASVTSLALCWGLRKVQTWGKAYPRLQIREAACTLAPTQGSAMGL